MPCLMQKHIQVHIQPWQISAASFAKEELHEFWQFISLALFFESYSLRLLEE